MNELMRLSAKTLGTRRCSYNYFLYFYVFFFKEFREICIHYLIFLRKMSLMNYVIMLEKFTFTPNFYYHILLVFSDLIFFHGCSKLFSFSY